MGNRIRLVFAFVATLPQIQDLLKGFAINFVLYFLQIISDIIVSYATKKIIQLTSNSK